jgi:hypothetical protein
MNRIPPEILALVPDFWDKHCGSGDQGLIALTHVCRIWREVFISRPSLWTDLDCGDGDKTRVYLERSKSLPVNLSLDTDDCLPSYSLFSGMIPHVIERLGSLTARAPPEELQAITDHLSRPAPLLEKLFICGDPNYNLRSNPVLTPALFNGDLSSLRKLHLESVYTVLPWRNMVNLTSFKLARMSSGGATIRQLLDFFESAPHLRKVILKFAAPISAAQNRRLVSLARLERMEITDCGSVSPLLDHLLIPVGARLTIEVDLPNPPIKDHPPRFLDNLRNLSDFTTIELTGYGSEPQIQFSGPNGKVTMIPITFRVDTTCFMIESLDQFDTSRTEQLTIEDGSLLSSDLSYRALLPMKQLRTLALRRCEDSDAFVRALHPNMSPLGGLICPRLEELAIVLNGTTLDITGVIGVVVARASRGSKLKSIRIVGFKPVRANLLEQLEQHVLHVEYVPRAMK